jgi:hypothetical protein
LKNVLPLKKKKLEGCVLLSLSYLILILLIIWNYIFFFLISSFNIWFLYQICLIL